MKIKTSRLIGPALDWAVAKCVELQGVKFGKGFYGEKLLLDENEFGHRLSYSTNWAQGGPIIEREGIDVFTEKKTPESWVASMARYQNGERLVGWRIHQYGPTPLIAAMRAYVVSKLGDEVDVPEELCA